VDVTVAITTRNRAPLLERTLGHVREACRDTTLSWELIVVDNGSSDRTREVLGRDHGLPLRALFEPRPAKAHAANRALNDARGTLIVWTDDDVRPHPGWLDAHVSGAARHPEASFFGGPVRPWFECEPPDWLARGIDLVPLPFALHDLGPDERPMLPHERANGPNFATRRSALEGRRWDPAFGPSPRRTSAGGETRLQLDLQRAGHAGVWLPGPVVDHWIAATSMNASYIAWRYRLDGATQMRLQPTLRGVLGSLATLLFEVGPRTLIGTLSGAPPRRRLRNLRRLHTHLGRLRGGLAAPPFGPRSLPPPRATC